jgi:hypothetical protein
VTRHERAALFCAHGALQPYVPGRSSATLDAMNGSTSGSFPLRLGWGTFLLSALVGAVPIGIIVSLDIGRPNLAPLAFLYTSLLAFFAYRWHVLRKLISAGVLSESNFRADPGKHFLGSRLVLVLWFGITIVASLSMVILQALRSS